jgi:hypothetical protein
MRIPASFHNGEWTEIDDWMELHPFLTYLSASLILLGIIGPITLVVLFVAK